MRFLNTEHENKFIKLIQRNGTHPKDKERISLFYILSGNADLFTKSDSIYDFRNQQIEPDWLQDGRVDFCSSSRALMGRGDMGRGERYIVPICKEWY
jgi:hypothetical protein